MDSTSATLLERVRDPQDYRSWQVFLDIYQPLIQYWLRKSGLQEADLMDLTQEILHTVTRELPKFRYDPAKRFRGWLRIVASHKLSEHFRRGGTRPNSSDQGLSEVLSADDDAFWDRDYRDWLFKRALMVMQTQFETQTWQAAYKTITTDASAREIANELGIAEASVYQAKSRVLRRLREELQGLWE